MNEESKILLNTFNDEFKNYKSYIDNNDWYDDITINTRTSKKESNKLNTEVSIIDTIIKSTNKFKEDVGEDLDKKPIQNFIKFTAQIIKKHIDGIVEYKKRYPLDNESGESDVQLHSDLFALITKTKVSLSKLQIDETEMSKKSVDLFFGNSKAPLLMRDSLCKKIKVIDDKTKNLGIDFSAPHINPATSNEMLINMKPKDIPPYDKNKHFFEQEKSTIQFWEEERIKIKKGINIGGYHISDWLYWHTNIFKLAYGSEEDKDMKVALLRDNEFFFDYMYNKAGSNEYGRHGIFLYGTRRFSKALLNTEKLYYKDGSIKNIGDSKKGDEIYGKDGKLTKIIGVYPQGEVELYKVSFADGRSIICCDDHLWTVWDNQASRERVLPLKEIKKQYKYERIYKDRKNNIVYNYYIPLNDAINYGNNKKPFIDPYYLGLWLGDGKSRNTSITNIDPEIIEFIKNYGLELDMLVTNTNKIDYNIIKKTGKSNKILEILRKKDLILNKHIPKECFLWGIEDRQSLLQGLMDSDGTVGKEGNTSFSNTNKNIIEGFLKLCRELGIGAYPYIDIVGNYTKIDGELNKYDKVAVFTKKTIFRLPRKRERHEKVLNRNNTSRTRQVPIVDIEYYGKDYATCIRVDNEDSLFITTNSIVTHNSVVMTSKVLHKLWTIENVNGTIQGFSKVPDLVAIYKYAQDALQEMYPALKVPINSMGIDEGIYLGIKGKKSQDVYNFADLAIVNLEGGNTKKGGQKTAAFTPDVFLLDEAGKGDCITPWKAAMPSFAGGKNGKWRLVPMLSGTAGEGDLSVDAETMLKNPKTYQILPMDYDFLEEFIDPEYVTWNRSKFGFFVPAQMSLEAPDKYVQPFSEFLKINKNLKIPASALEGLSKIDIHTTDWGAAKEFFEEKRKNVSSDVQLLAGETNSFPLDPEDCYVSTEVNKFPALESKNRKRFIEDEGSIGEKYRLHRDANGNFHAQITTDPLITDFPYKGGNFDAPVVMLENPTLDELPPLGLYTLGFDDVKQDKSDGDSVISATIFKRDFEGGEWADRFVAWYDSRPDRKQDYYKILYILIKIFNARVLAENEDNGFLEWMELNHMDDVHIHFSTGVGLASEENLNRNNNRKFGWAPTALNIYRLEQKLVMYSKADNITLNGIEGLSGIDRINHPMLLEEFYKYKKDGNADRIRSAGLAITLAQYYDKTYQYMRSRKKKTMEEDNKVEKKVISSRGLTDTKKLKKW